MDVLAAAVATYGPKVYALAALQDEKRWTLQSLCPHPAANLGVNLENIQALILNDLRALKQRKNAISYGKGLGSSDRDAPTGAR